MWLDVEDQGDKGLIPKGPHPQEESIASEQSPLATNHEEEQVASGTQGPPISL